jgi:hypothetical protein
MGEEGPGGGVSTSEEGRGGATGGERPTGALCIEFTLVLYISSVSLSVRLSRS